MAQTVRMVAQPPNIPSSHVLSGYSTIDNSQIHPSMSMMVSTLVPTQTLVTSHSQNMSNGIVQPSTVPSPMNPVNHLILQSPKMETGHRDQEKKIRREIANSNERRRMQSINAGFKSLKTILPHTDGEKLSKAAILQQTSEYITQLESDKLKLMHQNEKLRRALSDCKCSSVKRRGLGDIFDKDEGIGSPAEEDFEDLRRGMLELRQQLDKERRMRMIFEEQARGFENQLYPDRVQSMKLSSSDERRSSSECSPGASRPVISKPQTCARSLLPPLAPSPKLERTESAVYSTLPSNITMANPVLGSQSAIIQSIGLMNTCGENTTLIKTDSTVESASTSRHDNNSVTVFSHSTKSNQPLKKRAIEIHQSFADGSDDSITHQPNNKVAKISNDRPCVDHPPDIGTRSFLPPTLPPISLNDVTKSVPSMMHIMPASHLQPVSLPPSSIALPATAVIPIFNPIHAQQSPLLMSPDPPAAEAIEVKTISNLQNMPIATQELPSGATLTTTDIISPQTSIYTTSLHSTVQCHSGVGIDSKAIQLTTQEIMNAQHHLLKENNNRHTAIPPMYLTVGNFTQQADVLHLQRKNVGNTCPQLASSLPQPHFIVAPASTQGVLPIHNTVQHPVINRRKSEETARTSLQQHQRLLQPMNILRQADANVSRTTPVPVLPYNLTPGTHIANKTIYDNVHQPHNPTFLHSAALLKNMSGENKLVQDQNVQSPAQTILCHGQPEITLNQLNTMPNVLAQSRSLQQPVLQIPALPYVVKQYGSSSPSYASPVLQDVGLVQPRPAAYILPHSVRCRKSSMSATDSCSTASVSGAEEEEIRNPLLEDPDSQTGDNVPTIKLSQSHTITTDVSKDDPSTSPPQSSTNDEVAKDDAGTPTKSVSSRCVDVADSPCTTGETRLSVFSNPAGSPPVIRRIDAIQTRRNLETIVQAIDHLEQQERRNSQDRSSEVSNE